MLLAMMASAVAISGLTLFLRWRHTLQLALLCAHHAYGAYVESLGMDKVGLVRSSSASPIRSCTRPRGAVASRSSMSFQAYGLAHSNRSGGFQLEGKRSLDNKHPIFKALCRDPDLHVKWCTSIVEGCKAVANETNSSRSGGYLRAADRHARELR